MSLFRRKYTLKDQSESYTWTFDIRLAGARYRGSFGKVTQVEAEAIYAEMKTHLLEYEARERAKALTQRFVLPPRFDDFAAEYLAYYRANARPRSAERHEQAYRALSPVFAPLRLPDITPQHIEQYKQQRQAAGRSPVTINRALAFLKHLFTLAITWGRVTQNPVKRVRLFHEPQHRTRCLTDEEEARLLAACNPQLRALVIAALQTGCRRGELLALSWAKIDVERRLITVDAAYAKDKQTRTIPMSDVLLTAVQALPRPDEAQALVFGYRNVGKSFHRAVQRGAHLAHVKELLGHQNISMTMRYAHLDQEHTRATIALLSQQHGTGSPQTGEPDTRLRPSKIPLADAQAILQALAQPGVVDLTEGAIEERSPA